MARMGSTPTTGTFTIGPRVRPVLVPTPHGCIHMDALTRAARAMWLEQTPGTDPAMWDRLSQRTQIVWAMRASTIALAVANVWENH